MIDTKASELYIFLRYECDRIESFIIRDVGKLAARVVYMGKTLPGLGSLGASLETKEMELVI